MSEGCGRKLDDSFWKFCGDCFSPEPMPALCTECGGKYRLFDSLSKKKKEKVFCVGMQETVEKSIDFAEIGETVIIAIKNQSSFRVLQENIAKSCKIEILITRLI